MSGLNHPEAVPQPAPSPPAAAPLPGAYAGWWTRAGATFLDGVIVIGFAVGLGLLGSAIGGSDVGWAIGGAVWLAGLVFYGPALIAANEGRTWGKQACHIRVINADGASTGFGRAFLRETVIKTIFNVLSPVGLIDPLWAAWDGENRTLHDMACSTRVIRTPVAVRHQDLSWPG
jgi:uncharacterized RDD family membrane protein YckC